MAVEVTARLTAPDSRFQPLACSWNCCRPFQWGGKISWRWHTVVLALYEKGNSFV
jgi:hypothetical protein